MTNKRPSKQSKEFKGTAETPISGVDYTNILEIKILPIEFKDILYTRMPDYKYEKLRKAGVVKSCVASCCYKNDPSQREFMCCSKIYYNVMKQMRIDIKIMYQPQSQCELVDVLKWKIRKISNDTTTIGNII
jgi:hypothetical protein